MFQLDSVVIFVFLLVALAEGYPGSYDSQHSWVKGGLSEVVPKNALIGGFNDKGYQLYVGRRIYNNSVLPARVIVETGVSTANWNDTAWVINGATYQLLVTQPDMDYLWVHSYNGYYEQGAIAVGTSDMNERIFICRAQIKNGLMFGSLYLKQNRCVIDGNLLTLYEVLVARPKFEQNPKLQEFHSMPGVPESEDLPISEQRLMVRRHFVVNKLIHWSNALLDANFDGTDIKTINWRLVHHLFCIIIHKDSMYITDWRLDTSIRLHKRTGKQEEIMRREPQTNRLYGVYVSSLMRGVALLMTNFNTTPIELSIVKGSAVSASRRSEAEAYFVT
ncbi:uncharacterized protein LOC108598196 [Drosophila busckii]|uniref:uncharacterized protein LOC108598196 n=1 Tax=Drosophila busckii TaxID=30019 RepID=UPI00083F328F|nr:uncharacterized protein LOC108598196 [Drosophila busckii]